MYEVSEQYFYNFYNEKITSDPIKTEGFINTCAP